MTFARKTPMPRPTKPLERGKALRRVAIVRGAKALARRATPMPRKAKIDPEWTAVRKVVWERCGGRDEYSGDELNPRTWQCHHRQFRSRGGKHLVSNAVALTPANHRAVHGLGQGLAESRGFVVSAFESHYWVPLELWDGRVVYPNDEGGWRPVAAEPEES